MKEKIREDTEGKKSEKNKQRMRKSKKKEVRKSSDEVTILLLVDLHFSLLYRKIKINIYACHDLNTYPSI